VSGKPFLTTERLELWQLTPADRAEVHELTLGEEMRRYLEPGEPNEVDSFQRFLRSAGSWALYGYGILALREPGQSEIAGTCGLFHSFRGFGKGMDDVPEAGWIIGHRHWGKGYASEAMAAVLAWFDEAFGPRRVVCMIEEGNDASHAVARKLGFAAYDEHIEGSGARLTLYQRIT